MLMSIMLVVEAQGNNFKHVKLVVVISDIKDFSKVQLQALHFQADMPHTFENENKDQRILVKGLGKNANRFLSGDDFSDEEFKFNLRQRR